MTSSAMPPARRRAIPGMTRTAAAPPPPQSTYETETAGAPPGSSLPATPRPDRSTRRAQASTAQATPNGARAGWSGARERQPAADYASTRLVNFRIPVDLHDRFRALVREVEDEHPRLRHPSLTELVIALLEEGPQTAGEAAELIRRKRAAEHAETRT